MRKFDRGPRTFSSGKRVVLGLVGFMVLGSGIEAVMAGRLHAGNHWGAGIFAPYAVVVGVVVILVAIFVRRR